MSRYASKVLLVKEAGRTAPPRFCVINGASQTAKKIIPRTNEKMTVLR